MVSIGQAGSALGVALPGWPSLSKAPTKPSPGLRRPLVQARDEEGCLGKLLAASPSAPGGVWNSGGGRTPPWDCHVSRSASLLLAGWEVDVME